MNNNKKIYSIILLKESIISEIKNKDNTKIFEESIILAKLDEDFFENKSQEELLSYFNKNIPPLEYLNAYGEIVNSIIVHVIDYFEIIDEFEVENFTEIYNRHFIEKIGINIKDILNKYYNGFIFKE